MLHARPVHVGQHEVGRTLSGKLQCLDAIGGLHDLVACTFEGEADHRSLTRRSELRGREQ